jgi:hypothetical protein
MSENGTWAGQGQLYAGNHYQVVVRGVTYEVRPNLTGIPKVYRITGGQLFPVTNPSELAQLESAVGSGTADPVSLTSGLPWSQTQGRTAPGSAGAGGETLLLLGGGL